MFVIILAAALLLTGCAAPQPSPEPEPAPVKPSVAGISLKDTPETVEAVLGQEHQDTAVSRDEAGHYPEAIVLWKYASGITVVIGQESDQVLEVNATAPATKTNLGVQIGDKAEQVLAAYREKYIEPESIHGGQLIGTFKVEDGAAMVFDFGQSGSGKFPPEIDPAAPLRQINLTRPAHLDDSF
jgi:hypothetical protein